MKDIYSNKSATSECDANQVGTNLVHVFLNTPERSCTLSKHWEREQARSIQTQFQGR